MDYKLLNASGKTIATGTRRQMFSMIKHDVPDGRYRIVGPKYKLHCLRRNGIVEEDPDGVCVSRISKREYERRIDRFSRQTGIPFVDVAQSLRRRPTCGAAAR